MIFGNDILLYNKGCQRVIDSIRQKKLTSSDYDYDELDDLDDGLDEDDLSFLDSYEDEPEDASL